MTHWHYGAWFVHKWPPTSIQPGFFLQQITSYALWPLLQLWIMHVPLQWWESVVMLWECTEWPNGPIEHAATFLLLYPSSKRCKLWWNQFAHVLTAVPSVEMKVGTASSAKIWQHDILMVARVTKWPIGTMGHGLSINGLHLPSSQGFAYNRLQVMPHDHCYNCEQCMYHCNDESQ